jgi:predicted RNA-binding protein Jag
MRNNGSSGGNDGAILSALQAILNQLQAKEDGNQTLNLELKLGHYTLDEFALEIGRRLQKQERYRLRSSTI